MTPSHASGSASDAPLSSVPVTGSRTNSLQVSGASTMAAAGDGARGPATCQHCGGSGMLRLGDQRYRTCLECLGQGQLLRPSIGTLFMPRISVAAAASGAG